MLMASLASLEFLPTIMVLFVLVWFQFYNGIIRQKLASFWRIIIQNFLVLSFPAC